MPGGIIHYLIYIGVVVAKLHYSLFNIQCDKSIFENVFIWFLGQPVVWSEPNISQIEAWSSTIYAWCQEFEFDFFFKFFFEF
jgi:hypothetical protein